MWLFFILMHDYHKGTKKSVTASYNTNVFWNHYIHYSWVEREREITFWVHNKCTDTKVVILQLRKSVHLPMHKITCKLGSLLRFWHIWASSMYKLRYGLEKGRRYQIVTILRNQQTCMISVKNLCMKSSWD